MADVEILEEVTRPPNEDGWTLCFHWGEWRYEGGGSQRGYRFIWRDPDNNLRPQRGQARIPSAAEMFDLMSRAAAAGWSSPAFVDTRTLRNQAARSCLLS